jgi:hypothetical protein
MPSSVKCLQKEITTYAGSCALGEYPSPHNLGYIIAVQGRHVHCSQLRIRQGLREPDLLPFHGPHSNNRGKRGGGLSRGSSKKGERGRGQQQIREGSLAGGLAKKGREVVGSSRLGMVKGGNAYGSADGGMPS